MHPPEFDNYYRLKHLLVKACDTLRNQFKSHWSEISGAAWNSKSKDDFIKSLGSKSENFNTALAKNKDIDEWDITLLASALHCGKLYSSAKDKKLFLKNVKVIVKVRNENAHNATNNVTDEEFHRSREKITKALLSLGLTQEELEAYQSNDLSQKTVQISESVEQAQRLKEEGDKWLNKEKYEEAIALYTEGIITPHVPDHDLAVLYSSRSHCFLQTQDYEKSLADAKKARDLQNDWWESHFRIGNAYAALNKLDKAIKEFNKALVWDPKNGQVVHARADARQKKGMQDRYEHLTTKKTTEILQERIKATTGKSVSLIQVDIYKDVIIATDPSFKDVFEGHEHRDKEEYVQAARCYDSAMGKGNAEGMYNLGLLTKYGQGVNQDFPKALDYFKKAASQDLINQYGIKVHAVVAEAEHAIGLGYAEGTLAGKDQHEAYSWYRRALSHGSGEAANKLGLMYMNGTLVQKNLEVAEEFFLLAFDCCNDTAMDSLVLLYLRKQDIKKAIEWNKRAINGNSFTALRIRDQIEEHIKQLGYAGITDWEKKQSSDQVRGAEELGNATCSPNEFDVYEDDTPTPKRTDYKFDDATLLKLKDSSPYVAKIYTAVQHYHKAVRELQNGGADEIIITSLAECYRIEGSALSCNYTLRQRLKQVVERLLNSQDPKLDQDARLCFVALHTDSIDGTIDFLTESIKKYPSNLDFLKLRGLINCYLARNGDTSAKFEDTLRDFDRVLLKQPNDYETMYHRAQTLSLLAVMEHSKITALGFNDTSITLALEEFGRYLRLAPKDHCDYPESCYAMASLHLASGTLGECIIKANEYFELGQEAEKLQLPFFLPCDPPSKKSFKIAFAVHLKQMHPFIRDELKRDLEIKFGL